MLALLPTEVLGTLFGQEDAIISDELNHASIIDGVRLCKAVRYRYKHANMEDLEEQLKFLRPGVSGLSLLTEYSMGFY